MDSRRARSIHHNSNRACLEAWTEQERRARVEEERSSTLHVEGPSDSTSQGATNMSLDESHLSGAHSQNMSIDSDHSFPIADEQHSSHSSVPPSDQSSCISDYQTQYLESDEELDVVINTELELSSGSSTGSDAGSSSDDQEQEQEESDGGENSETGIMQTYVAQSQLESFLGQPLPEESLPADLDLTYRILDALLKCGAPLSCFDKIVELTRRACRMQVPLKPISRQKAMSDLRRRFNQQELTPIQTEQQLPSGLTAKITTIDFCAALGSLLSDPLLMKDDHLHLYEQENGDAMGEPPQLPPDNLVDILDGDVCRDAYRLYVKRDTDFLVPIIMFIDKTHVDLNGRLTLEPLCMTLGIFKKEYRRQPDFWRTLGFVNTSRESVELKPEQKLRDYHYVLSHILQSYKDAQKMELEWNLHYKGKIHNVTLQIPLLYIVGDTEGHDKLCGHYQNRTKSAYLCRYCQCPREETGNPNAQHKKTLASKISKLVEQGRTADLKKLSYHAIDNAFDGILFCDPVRGINGATPGELLHVIQHGLHNYLHSAILNARKEVAIPPSDPDRDGQSSTAKETSEDGTVAQARKDSRYMSEFQQPIKKSEMKVMPNSVLKKVDTAAKQYGQWLVHQSDREYHRAFFKDGISSTACKQGHEERMVLLLFLILFSSNMFPVFKRAFGSEERLSLYVLVISHFIMLEDFMKSDTILRDDVETLEKYMPKFMELFKRATDREEGMGMNIIKFHLLRHLAEDILRFGPCTGFDSSFCESMHKMYKLDAQRTQKRTDDSFQYQTAKRSCERIAIACGMRSVLAEDERNRIPKTLSRTVRTYGTGTQLLRNATQRNTGCPFPPPVPVWKMMQKLQPDRDLWLKSVADIHGNLYRSQWWKANPRYDWAYVNWEDWGNVVARFKCFFELENGETMSCAHTNVTFQGPGCFALAEAFTQDYNVAPPDDASVDNHQAHSASSLIFRMEVSSDRDGPQLFIVDLERMVVGPAAVVPFDASDNDPMEWLVIAPKWERKNIFRDNMSELLAKSRKRK